MLTSHAAQDAVTAWLAELAGQQPAAPTPERLAVDLHLVCTHDTPLPARRRAATRLAALAVAHLPADAHPDITALAVHARADAAARRELHTALHRAWTEHRDRLTAAVTLRPTAGPAPAGDAGRAHVHHTSLRIALVVHAAVTHLDHLAAQPTPRRIDRPRDADD